jgi:hypothetical protein
MRRLWPTTGCCAMKKKSSIRVVALDKRNALTESILNNVMSLFSQFNTYNTNYFTKFFSDSLMQDLVSAFYLPKSISTIPLRFLPNQGMGVL